MKAEMFFLNSMHNVSTVSLFYVEILPVDVAYFLQRTDVTYWLQPARRV